MNKNNIINISRNILSNSLGEIVASELLFEYFYFEFKKIFYTKTFINRQNLIEFNDFYVPIVIENNNFKSVLNTPKSFFDQYKLSTIIGQPGSGKTTFLKHVYIKSWEQEYKIPLFIELRKINFEANEPIFDRIPKEIINEIKLLLSRNKLLLLLDGVDEISQSNLKSFINYLEKITIDYPETQIMCTSRPLTSISLAPNFHEFNILPFKRNDIIQFVKNISGEDELKMKIIESINELSKQDIYDFLSSPLLLSVYVLSYSSYSMIPRSRYLFIRNILDTLYSTHDSITKIGFIREKVSNLSKEDFETILSSIAIYMTMSDKNQLDYSILKEIIKKVNLSNKDVSFDKVLYDLTVTFPVFAKEPIGCYFIHVIFKDYYSALFISRLNINQAKSIYGKLTLKYDIEHPINLSLNRFMIEMDTLSYLKYFYIEFSELHNNFENDNFNKLSQLVKNFLYSSKILNRKELTNFELIGRVKEYIKSEESDIIDIINLI